MKLAPLLFVALLSSAAAATNHYVTQAGAGLQTGTAAAPWSVADLNDEWSQVAPGDTVVLMAGNITSQITISASGAAGNPITILFAPGATMSVPAWSGNGAISIPGLSYIVIDGGATGAIGGYGANGTPNGIIENSANGTNLANKVNTCGIALTGSCTNVTIQNLVIANPSSRSPGAPSRGGRDFYRRLDRLGLEEYNGQ